MNARRRPRHSLCLRCGDHPGSRRETAGDRGIACAWAAGCGVTGIADEDTGAY
jgi:hypothetical protein